MVKQKGGILPWLMLMNSFKKPQAQPQQRGGLYVHRKKRKQKGGRTYAPIEEIRRKHFRKIMLKAIKNKKFKKQKGGWIIGNSLPGFD